MKAPPLSARNVAFGLTILFCLSLSFGCTNRQPRVDELASQPTILLISLDGFRWDYPEKTETPNLDFLIKTGVRAKALTPSFPTKTFPNHYTIVTGLYPENHGIVANTMFDPEMEARFSMGNRSAVQDGRWWGGEPIWVTAHRHGKYSAPYFWPGSEAEIKGVRPKYWTPYDGTIPDEQRIKEVVRWLKLPKADRPAFITLYFSLVDDAGHRLNPDSVEMFPAIQAADRLLGLVKSQLQSKELFDQVNIIVVSDHGMAATSSQRVILIDDYIDLSTVDVVDWSPVIAIKPKPGMQEAIYNQLSQAHPNLKVYKRNEVPERLRYRNHPRIADIIGIADEGWSISSREFYERRPGRFDGGTHGFDNQLPSMGALFVARGPAFKSGLIVDAFENVHLYELMCEILAIKPAPNDGDLNRVRNLLRSDD